MRLLLTIDSITVVANAAGQGGGTCNNFACNVSSLAAQQLSVGANALAQQAMTYSPSSAGLEAGQKFVCGDLGMILGSKDCFATNPVEIKLATSNCKQVRVGMPLIRLVRVPVLWPFGRDPWS